MTFNRTDITRGILAGFIATVVLTLFMMLKSKMGVLPALDPIHMMNSMIAQNLGIAENAAIGWFMHFVLGSIAWGVGFAVLNNALPGSKQLSKGIVMGIGAWLLMMFGLMPISGSGLFGLAISPMAPVATLILHIIFGAALGLSYQKFNQHQVAITIETPLSGATQRPLTI